MTSYDLVIIGAGAAGLSAAISAYDNKATDILLLEKDTFLGGILNQCIHPGFGLDYFKEELTGPEYAERLIDEVKKRNIRYSLNTLVLNISDSKEVTYINETEGYTTVKAKAVILAAGCYERHGGMIELSGDRPQGVMTAGLAQRYMNIDGYMVGKRIFILGSGNIGLIMARRLTLEGAQVLGVAEINPYSAGSNSHIVQCLTDFDIPLFLSHTVVKVTGKKNLEKIMIAEVDNKYKPIPGTEKEFEVDTLLLSIGLIPSNELLDKLGLPVSQTKGAVVDQNLETYVDGIFSCGNVLHVHDLVDQATFEGLFAGKKAAEYISGKKERSKKTIPLTAGEGIAYVVPQLLDTGDLDKDFNIKFRVRNPVVNQYIVIRNGDAVIKKLFRPVLIPAEMINLPIPGNSLKIEGAAAISVSLEAKI